MNKNMCRGQKERGRKQSEEWQRECQGSITVDEEKS